ncbi:hypothetical protein HDA32_005481 [Spinactinospora alkalitolerans]|uniref:Uncharacterized protein n=1 Tax=Spinactinospora alkalitolerans TaxID=687207 RepID=A0A852U2K3_9ACTN|nr:hypothetical protein [Spinactinospora alkalitolerans]NYE50361.1 hypothetical protein [Spinactinospora alkalitolerans]
MYDFLLVLAGGGISLVSSAAVTWLQGRHSRRTEGRAAAREATRQLTGLFITERDTPSPGDGTASSALAEAEILSVTIADRRVRDRVRDVIRLLRECRLPELEELSGVKAERAVQMLCDHALEVLGAHFRGDRLPALPQNVQKMLDAEEEALNIHAGGAPKQASAPKAPAADAPAAAASPEPPTSRKVRRKPRSASTIGTDGAAADDARSGDS